MAPTMPTTTTSGAQLHFSKPGPWEMKKYCEEPLVLLGKQTINLWAHEQVSGLTYLPVSFEERRKTLRSSVPLFHVHTLLQPQEMLWPCSFLENMPCFSCCHGTTRRHQNKPPYTWGRSTKVLSLQLLGLDHTKLIILFDILWRAQPLWTTQIKRNSYLGACNFFWLFFLWNSPNWTPQFLQSMFNKHGSGTSAARKTAQANETASWGNRLER